MKKIFFTFILLLITQSNGIAEPNESPEKMNSADSEIKKILEEYSRTKNYKLLIEERDISSCINARQSGSKLEPLDERCLRLQLQIMMTIQKERDLKYDLNAPDNIVYMNVSPPNKNESYKGPLFSGMDPKAINDPTTRKNYEDAIKLNYVKNEKLRRERSLSRAVDRAVITIYRFVRQFPDSSQRRIEADSIVEAMAKDPMLLKRLKSNESPGLTW